MASEDGLIIATELTCDTTDTGWFTPMLRHAEDAAALITAHQPPPARARAAKAARTARAAGSGCCSLTPATCPRTTSPPPALTGSSPPASTATWRKPHARPPPGTPPAEDGTRRRGAHRGDGRPAGHPEGITAYRRRGHIAETPHGHIKHNMGIRQLATRGKPKASAEWTFTVTVHNLLKAITTGHLTPAALATLAT